jgi:predicted acyltransferase (DUF342 family)
MKTIKIMKKTSILAMLCIGLMSCNSEIESLEFEEANLTSKKTKSSESTVNYATAASIVDLGTAGSYTILSKSGITNVYPSDITGNVGTSPITGAALLLTCAEVTGGGEAHTVAAAGPLGCPTRKTTAASTLTTAVGDMEAAYTAAASLTHSSGDHLNVDAGSLGVGVTLEPGVYTWGSTLLIPSDIILDSDGMSDPKWIFQVAGTLTVSNDVKMTFENNLTTGDLGKAEDVFWQVSGAVTLGTGSHFVGNLLGKTSIAVQTHATVNGRLLAQTAVTLQKNIVWAGSAPPAALVAAATAAVKAAADAAAQAAQASATAAGQAATAAQDAATAAQDAATAADATYTVTAADAAAQAAQDAADDAQDAADDAQDAANDAQIAANDAQIAANVPADLPAAVTAADLAATKAKDAQDAAKDAQDAADLAATKADLAAAIQAAADAEGADSAVDLGMAGSFAILSKSGITNVYESTIIGDVGTSPITGAALLLTDGEIVTGTGNIYTVAAAGPAGRLTDADKLATAVLDMQAAYENAAGRTLTPSDVENLGAGNIGGLTLTPGLYKWSSALLIPTNITLDAGGDADAKWIFQVAGTLTVSNGVGMTIINGAQTKNIVWQVSGAVTLGTNSHFEGTLLGKTSIAVQTDASVNGRLLAQTAVTLQMNTVTAP